MSDFGTDLACLGDLSPELGVIEGSRVLSQALARRLSTPRGSLFYDPSYGLDVRAWLHESLTQARLFPLCQVLETEVEKDDRVLSASAEVELNSQTHTLRIRIDICAESGPVSLVLSATSNAVSLLSTSCS